MVVLKHPESASRCEFQDTRVELVGDLSMDIVIGCIWCGMCKRHRCSKLDLHVIATCKIQPLVSRSSRTAVPIQMSLAQANFRG